MAEKYSKLNMIGAGSFGKAWLVTKKDSGKKYVIKEVLVSGMSEKERSQSLTEVEALARCRHLNIIRYKDAFVAEGAVLHIVMEYASGGDLQKKIEQQSGVHFEKKVVIDWFTQMCFAIKYIHERNILHRDLKTQNIFLGQHNLVKIADFGICKMLHGSQDHANTVIGTPYYLSPEICQQQPYNQKSDMWSLGCVLYELSQLTPPFTAPNFSSLVVKIMQAQYLPIPSVYGQLLSQLVSVLLSKEADGRPSADQLLSLPAMQIYVQAYVDRAQILKECCSSPSTPRNKHKLSDTSNKENMDPGGSEQKVKWSRKPSPGQSPLASNRTLVSSPNRNPSQQPTGSPQVSLFRELVSKKQARSSVISQTKQSSSSMGSLKSPVVSSRPPGKSELTTPTERPTHHDPGKEKVMPRERGQQGSEPSNSGQRHPPFSSPRKHTPSDPFHTYVVRSPLRKIDTSDNRQPQSGSFVKEGSSETDRCRSVSKPADSADFFSQIDSEMCRYLYHSCLGERRSEIDSNIRVLLAFLEDRLGTHRVRTVHRDITDCVMNGREFSEISHYLQGNILRYFPLIMQVVQLERLQKRY